MVRIGLMASPKSLLDRRELMAGLGAAALLPIWPATGSAQGRAALALQAKADVLALRPGAPETPIWSLGGPELRFKRGETVEVAFANELPQPVALNWRGLDGVAEHRTADGPRAARSRGEGNPATAAAACRNLAVRPRPARRWPGAAVAGTGLGGPGNRARRGRSRRGAPGRGMAAAAGRNRDRARDRPQGCHAGFDGQWPAFARYLQREPMNGSGFASSMAASASVIAVKLENLDVRVMAIDGQPAEPFLARNGALVLAPGGRVDAFVDVTAPAGTTPRSCSTTARKPARSASSSSRATRRSARRRCHRRRRCPPTACRRSSTSRARPAPIWPSAGPRRLGAAGQLRRDRRRPRSAPKPAASWCWR